MSAMKVYKFRDITEVKHFLDGGLLGGGVVFPAYGLVGKVITFVLPTAAACTFTAGADATGLSLTFKEVKTQLEAAVANLKVVNFSGGVGGNIAVGFIHATLAGAVTLAALNEPARAILGFANNAALTGKLYNPPGGAAPSFIQAYAANDGSHTIYTLE